MWKNQKGFSLIELIIVIAIIAVLAGASVAMFGHISYANTKKAAAEVDSALSKLRLDTMSDAEHEYLYIYPWTDGYYMKLVDANESVTTVKDNIHLNGGGTRLCGTNVEIYADGRTTPISGEEFIRVAYKKNGTFLVETDTPPKQGTNASTIEIRGSGTYKISLDYTTGKHYME